jgi:hypothetical protein
MYTFGITLYGLFDFTFDLTPLQRRKDGSAVFYKALLRTNNTLSLRSPDSEPLFAFASAFGGGVGGLQTWNLNRKICTRRLLPLITLLAGEK